MTRSLFLSLALVLLLHSVPLRARWSGSADLAGGLGGMEGSLVTDDKPMFHGLVQGNFLLNYKTEKFGWTTKVTGKWEPKTTDNGRIAYKNENLGVVYKAATTKTLTITTIFKEYCELSANIQKEFKHITLYLEGKDLLDQPKETSFYSEELKEFWVEEVRSNRRIIVLAPSGNSN